MKQSSIRMRDEVTESLSRSMGLWNSMMTTLSHRTSLDVSSLQQSLQSSSFLGGQSSSVN